MRRPWVSPNDPLFFLHHANIDRIWWEWQQKDPTVRNYEIAGKEFDGSVTTLETVLEMMGSASNKVVRDVMVTDGESLCYRY